ncbi:MAG: sigma factor-like helix-turn-helix DNA-binding protein, partial [archaeon]|nr:sigma factor-like helix-turn-helix DNA-binding protein [archaeon]
MAISYTKVNSQLVSELSPRTKNILVERFGLQSGKPRTLDSIGRKQGITRERVRQIVEDGLSLMRSRIQEDPKKHAVSDVFTHFSQTLQGAGSVKREDLLLDALGANQEAPQVVFLLHIGDQFINQRETVDFHPFWASKREYVDSAPELHRSVQSHLKKQKQAVSFEDLKKAYVGKEIGSNGVKIPLSTFSSFLETSKHIMQGYDRNWGLKEWAEVNPKG